MWQMYALPIAEIVEAVVLVEVVRLLNDWARAEAVGDFELLERLLDSDFRGDDAQGSVLTKAEWLDRRRGGAESARFVWNPSDLTVGNGVAIARGAHSRDAELIATVVAVQRDECWRVVNVQRNGRGRARPSTERESP